MAKVLDIIRDCRPKLGNELNIHKTEIFQTSCDGNNQLRGFVPFGYWRVTLGVKLLEGTVSQDRGLIGRLAMNRASRAIELMHLLPKLHDL